MCIVNISDFSSGPIQREVVLKVRGHGVIAPIFMVPPPFNQVSLLQVVDHCRNVAVTFQDLSADFTLAKRAKMIERFHNRKLADTQVVSGQVLMSDRGDFFARPHQFNVGIQSIDLRFAAVKCSFHNLSKQ